MHDDTPDDVGLPLQASLRDGRTVTLRAICAEDRDELLDAFHRLSPESRYTRFMMAVREPSPAMLEAATHPLPERDFALVAVAIVDGAEDIVGGARYAQEPAGATCEFAVTVVDDWHGIGLASRLMRVLIAHARSRGLRCMEGYVLTRNDVMRHLARHLGFADHPCADDATLRVVRLDLVDGGCGDGGGGGISSRDPP